MDPGERTGERAGRRGIGRRGFPDGGAGARRDASEEARTEGADDGSVLTANEPLAEVTVYALAPTGSGASGGGETGGTTAADPNGGGGTRNS